MVETRHFDSNILNVVQQREAVDHDQLRVMTLFSEQHCREFLHFIQQQFGDDIPYDKTCLNKLGFTQYFNDLIRHEQVRKHLPQWFRVDSPVLSNNVFVVMYDEQNQEYLDLHTDDSDLTLNICLSDQFEGGEVVFYAENETKVIVEHQIGQCVMHAGDLSHQPQPMKRGKRVNLIVWYRTEARHAPQLNDVTSSMYLITGESSNEAISVIDLPDDILFYTLSFLSCREVIDLDTVSKSWRNLVQCITWSTLEVAALSKSITKSQLRQHFPSQTLKKVSFVGFKEISTVVKEHIAECPQIEVVDFTECSDASLQLMGEVLMNCKESVTEISLAECKQMSNTKQFNFSRFTKLRKMNAAGVSVTQNQLQQLLRHPDIETLIVGISPEAPKLPAELIDGKLRVLNLGLLTFTKHNASILSRLSCLEELQFRSIQWNVESTLHDIQAVASIPNLRKLTVSGWSLNDHVLNELCSKLGDRLEHLYLNVTYKCNSRQPFSHFRSLKSLGIENGMTMSQILDVLTYVNTKQLTELNLQLVESTINAADMTNLATAVPGLRKLNLTYNMFEDGFVLLPLKKLTLLEELILDNIRSTTPHIEIPMLPELRLLSIQRCSELQTVEIMNRSTTSTILVSQLHIAKSLASDYPKARCIASGPVITVAQLNNAEFKMSVDLRWSIRQLKEAVSCIIGEAPENQRFIFAGKRLCDEHTLESYGVKDGSKLHMVLRLRG